MKNLLEKTINQVLLEMEYSETFGSAGGECGAFSHDAYAKGDARVPKVLGAVITRQGSLKKKRRKNIIKKIN